MRAPGYLGSYEPRPFAGLGSYGSGDGLEGLGYAGDPRRRRPAPHFDRGVGAFPTLSPSLGPAPQPTFTTPLTASTTASRTIAAPGAPLTLAPTASRTITAPSAPSTLTPATVARGSAPVIDPSAAAMNRFHLEQAKQFYCAAMQGGKVGTEEALTMVRKHALEVWGWTPTYAQLVITAAAAEIARKARSDFEPWSGCPAVPPGVVVPSGKAPTQRPGGTPMKPRAPAASPPPSAAPGGSTAPPPYVPPSPPAPPAYPDPGDAFIPDGGPPTPFAPSPAPPSSAPGTIFGLDWRLALGGAAIAALAAYFLLRPRRAAANRRRRRATPNPRRRRRR